PSAGAVVHYWLKQKPKSDLVLEILDERGKKVRTLTSKEAKHDETEEDLGSYSDRRPKPVVLSVEPGLHRVIWDLCHEGAKEIPKARVDAGQPITGPMAIPGKYTLKLTADGKTLTQSIEIKSDPRLKISSEELIAQSDLTLKLRDDISRLADIV